MDDIVESATRLAPSPRMAHGGKTVHGARLGILIVALSVAGPWPATAAEPSLDEANSRFGGAVFVLGAAGVKGENPDLPADSLVEKFLDDIYGKERARTGLKVGSGFIIDAKGHAVTTAAVASSATALTVKLADGRRLGARLVATDSRTGLSVIRIQADGLPHLNWGDSSRVFAGDAVLVLNGPLGGEATATRSRIEAVDESAGLGPYDSFFRTGPSFVYGEMGGAMIDGQGRVTGILMAILKKEGEPIGAGLVMPANQARPVVEQLIAEGRVRRGWLGVHIQAVTDEFAKSFGLDRARGALVASVIENGPAAKAGIEAGDVILEFNGRALDQMRDLPRLVADAGVGQPARMVVWRDTGVLSLTVRLEEFKETPVAATPPPIRKPPSTDQAIELPSMGVRLEPLTATFRQQHSIPADVTGVAVTRVDPGSSAAERGVTAGNVIIQAPRKKLSTPMEVATHVNQAQAKGGETVVLMVHGKEGLRFAAIKIDKSAPPAGLSAAAAPAPPASTKAQTAPSAPVARLASRFPASPAPINFPKAPPRPDDIAVIIGNADYSRFGRDIPDVTPAYADAESFKRYVTEALGVRPGNIIDLRDATSAQLVSVFGSPTNHKGKLFNWTRPERSRIIIYYAGHEAPAGSDGSAYLVPTDADAATIDLNDYQLSTLYANLGKVPAESITVVLEACFSGASQAGTVISNASPVYLKAKIPEIPPNVTVIAAGAPNQMASWEDDKSHGLFTKYFLMGMSGKADAAPYGNGDGRVDYAELDKYLKGTLTYYARRYYGRDQTAQIVVGGNN